MPIDLRRCAEAAVRAVLAEAFARPEPKQSRRGRRRRRRPLRLLMRAMRAALIGVGLWTTVRTVRDPELRREAVDAVAQRFPVEKLLEELAVEVEAARLAVSGDQLVNEADAHAPGEPQEEQEENLGAQRHRRPAPRRRGDRNGQRGRKPPNRGTRA